MSALRRRHVLCWSLAALASGCGDEAVTVFVVRHAEKAKSNSDDPELSTAGKARAATLPAALGGAKLTAVFSTPYQRTQHTVDPAAKAHGLPVQTVAADDINTLVAKVRALPKGSAVLIAGHSNTVPAIIAALGVAEPVTLGEDSFGDLFVVTLSDPPKLERRRFG